MLSRHNSIGRVRNYLLGKLNPEEADSLEERYFADSHFLREVQDIEERMIVEYLHGRLGGEDGKRFEDRYLTVPELAKRVEEIRGRLQTGGLPFQMRWKYVVAGLTLIACALAPWLFLAGNGKHGGELARNQPPVPPPAVLEVRLRPGLDKSANTKQVGFAQPLKGRVRLTLEMPGQASPVQCVATLALAGQAGVVWRSPEERSETEGAGQVVRVEIDAAALAPNDYIGSVSDRRGQVLETYSFRVNPGN